VGLLIDPTAQLADFDHCIRRWGRAATIMLQPGRKNLLRLRN
jgi:hypothetical protein